MLQVYHDGIGYVYTLNCWDMYLVSEEYMEETPRRIRYIEYV